MDEQRKYYRNEIALTCFLQDDCDSSAEGVMEAMARALQLEVKG